MIKTFTNGKILVSGPGIFPFGIIDPPHPVLFPFGNTMSLSGVIFPHVKITGIILIIFTNVKIMIGMIEMTRNSEGMSRANVPRGRGLRLHEQETPLVQRTVFDTAELGRALKLRRRELGYTQEVAAQLCMRSTRVIGDIERGRSTVEIGIVLEYAALLSVDVVLETRGRAS